MVAALEKPIGLKFRRSKKVVVNKVVAKKRSVKSEKEDLIVAVSRLSRSLSAIERLGQKQRSNAKGEDDLGEKKDFLKEKKRNRLRGFNTLNY